MSDAIMDTQKSLTFSEQDTSFNLSNEKTTWQKMSPDCVDSPAYLCWDGSILPILCQVDLRDKAVMTGSVGQEHRAEWHYSIGHHAEAEKEKNDLLETAPLTQKSHGVIIILHRLRVPPLRSSLKVEISQRYTDRQALL